ncbi:MAG TPA: SDR family NAD(P)-dependent oxidoreductase [Polyangiales bacterium]
MRTPKTVAIFGATSAVAQDVARLYAAQGARLALVGRNPTKLRALSDEIEPQVAFLHVQDFADTAAAEACVLAVARELGGIDVALIAHGLLGDQRESEQTLAPALEMAHVNYTSVVALLIPLANVLAAQGRGQIAVISSVAAERGRPRNYTYAAAKSALNTYLQGLRSRLYASGVTVHTIKLGPTDTPMTVDHRKNALFTSSAEAGRGIVDALARDVSEAYVPRYWRPIMFVVRNLPEAVFQRIGALSGR